MKVVLAIDDSPNSQAVVETVGRRKWPESTQFKILTVLEPLERQNNHDFADVIAAVKDERKRRAQDLCEKARHRLECKVPHAIVHFEIREGQPRAEILDAASEWSADKIVLGAHSRDVCPHNLLGSVSRGVASHASCSIEIVRPKVQIREKITV